MKRYIYITFILIFICPLYLYADGIRFSLYDYNTFNDNVEYSSTREMPILKISAHWNSIYAFMHYSKEEMVYMGQKSYIANNWGCGFGIEKEIMKDLYLFGDVGYYFRGIDKFKSFNESIRYLFDKQFDNQPNFTEYDIEIEPALGVNFGGRYYLTDQLSFVVGLHFRKHDANIYGYNEDKTVYWTMKYNEVSNKYYAGFSWDFN